MASLHEPFEFGSFAGSDRVLLERSADERRWPSVERDRKDDRLQALTRTVESEIIPRLMLAHRAGALANPLRTPQPLPPGRTVGSDDVVQFASIVLGYEVSNALGFIEAVRAEGVSFEAVFLDLLAPTARHLGDLWKADLCDFTDVTVGLMRLHQIVHRLSPAFENEAAVSNPGARALIAPMPGDQHTFGSMMVAEFLRRDGWEVCGPVNAGHGELIDLVGDHPFALVGLSLSCERLLDGLASLIRQLRTASRNPELWVMVGGRVFLDHPDYVARVGADATAIDGRQVVQSTRHLARVGTARH
ncbi:MAG TPA: cobalamin B12-binding domain-containing protein [Beijerinckiaceae bacterium]